MIVKKKRILSIEKYLRDIESNRLYVSVPTNEENLSKLKNKYHIENYEIGSKVVPVACGPITKFNIDGKEVVRKDKAKIERDIEREYHVIDWHGKDHYGVCFQTRMCYPRDIIVPPLERIVLGSINIYSDIIDVENKDRLKHIINMFLEIFGYCKILDGTHGISNRDVEIISLPWKILPTGDNLWEKKIFLKKYLNQLAKKDRKFIKIRHEVILNYNPDFIAVGLDSFSGYIVYGFSTGDVYIFESNQKNNATYIFKGKWEDASKLTKRDVILGNLCEKRIIHSKYWENEINRLLENVK